MADARMLAIARRYAFEQWRGLTTLPQNLFVWRYLLLGSELPGWRLHRVRRFQGPEGLTVVQSVWQRLLGASLLGIDVIECESLAAAHDRVLQVLGSFEAPVMEREAQPAAGDVGFVAPREHVQVFARANLVFLVRNAGPVSVPVTPLAARLDRRLVTPPVAREEAPDAPTIGRLAVRKVANRPEVRLGLAVERPTGPDLSPMVKLFSAGEVTRAGDRLTYRPAGATDELTVYAVAANLLAARRQFRVAT